MKNIYEDGTLPGAPDIPEIKRQSANPPTRPRKQLQPTPMQQEQLQRQQQAQAQPQPQPQPAPYGAMPVYAVPGYAYVPVGTDANGQPVYAPAPQMPYPPQGMPVYPYAPYMSAVPQATIPTVPEQPAAPKGDGDPGTRVLYQSPDFDMSDGAPVNTEVGASFAQGSLRKEMPELREEFEAEEVSLAASDKADKAMLVSESIEIDEVYFDSEEFQNPTEENNAALYGTNETVFTEEILFMPEKKNGDVALNQADKKKKEKKKISKGEIVRRVVLSVAIIAIVISAGMLINEYRLAEQNEELEEEISNLIIEEPTTKNKKDDEDDEDEPTEVQLTPEQQWAKIRREYPNVIFPANIQLKYAKLYAENRDFVGYLSADAIGLNLPVVQSNNDEEYLKKNFYGQTTKYGCPFVTHLNNINPLDMNTVIFGHHMNNKTIFGTLDAYKKIDGFKKAPVITFNTLYKDYSWKIVAVFITNAYGKDDLNNYVFPYYFTKLSTYDRFSAYLNELSQRSLYDTGVDVVATDKILTLSTCSHEFEDARFVVVARLVRPGESTSVDTSKAVVNSNPRYPQAYYNAKKIKTNPYKNASQWQAG